MLKNKINNKHSQISDKMLPIQRPNCISSKQRQWNNWEHCYLIQAWKCSTTLRLDGRLQMIFRKICKISLIYLWSYLCLCLCVCPSVCMSVCLCVTIVSLCYTLAKIKNVKNDVWIIWHVPSNGVIAKIVPRDRDLLFEGQHFKMLISLKRWELAQNAPNDFVDLNICQRMIPLRNLYLVTLIYFWRSGLRIWWLGNVKIHENGFFIFRHNDLCIFKMWSPPQIKVKKFCLTDFVRTV